MFRAFLAEQRDPETFYRALAVDTVALVGAQEPLTERIVVDVGAGRPQFAQEFTRAGARYLPLDLDRAALLPLPAGCAVQGRGEQLPLADACADIVLSSNVAEHVRQPAQLLTEMIRITRPGGLIFMAFTAWASPWGGHETSPWHWLGGEYAARRYQRRHGHPPKNGYGVSLFPTPVTGALRLAHAHPQVWVIDAFPRYHPDWASGILLVPGVREVGTWNLTMLLRRR